MQQPHQQQQTSTKASASGATSSWKMSSLSSQQQAQDERDFNSSTTNFHSTYDDENDLRGTNEVTGGAHGVNGSSQESSSMSPEKSASSRLALKQLERFRMAVQKGTSTRSSRWTAKARGAGVDDASVEFDNLFMENAALNSWRELKIITYPWPMWILGSCIIVATSIYMNHVTNNHLHRNAIKEIDDEESDWWKYLVGCVVYFVGVGLILNGRVETFRMNKDLGRLLICSTKPLCLIHKFKREKKIDRELRHITDVRVEAMGEFTGDIDTRSYQIHFDFEDGSHASSLEARSKSKTMKRCRVIKHFLLFCAGSFSSLPTTRTTSISNRGTKNESPSSMKKNHLQDLESASEVSSICSISSYEDTVSFPQ